MDKRQQTLVLTQNSSQILVVFSQGGGLDYGEQGSTAPSWNRAWQSPASRTEPAAAVNSLSNPCPGKWHWPLPSCPEEHISHIFWPWPDRGIGLCALFFLLTRSHLSILIFDPQHILMYSYYITWIWHFPLLENVIVFLEDNLTESIKTKTKHTFSFCFVFETWMVSLCRPGWRWTQNFPVYLL